jgi:alcohol dehydrogenase class IV
VTPALLADQVVLDSRFLSTVSEATMACSVADAISHAVESWMSIVPGRLPREAAVSCLRLILGDGPAYDRAARLLDAGFLGGVAAAHCSVGVIHAYAHSMARFGLGHGHANALALLPGLRRLLDLPAAVALLDQVGMSAQELTTRVAALIAPAVCQPESAIATAILSVPDDRRALLDAITADPCLRTCPLPAAALDLESLLDEVGDGVAQRC